MANYELNIVRESVTPCNDAVTMTGGLPVTFAGCDETIIALIEASGMVVGDVTYYVTLQTRNGNETVPMGRECWFEDLPDIKFRAVRSSETALDATINVQTANGWSAFAPAVQYNPNGYDIEQHHGEIISNETRIEKIKLANGGYFIQGVTADGTRSGNSLCIVPMYDFECANFISWVTVTGDNVATRCDNLSQISKYGLCSAMPISVIDTYYAQNEPMLSDNEMVLSTIARENRVAFPHFNLHMLANSTISLKTNIKERIVVNGGEMFIVRTNRGYISYFPEPTEEETPKT